MGKRVIREDHISHERWMVSYADFMTLLLAFFVVMYSVSQLNEDKYRVLTRTLEKAFNVPESSINPIQVGDPVTAVDPGVIEDAIESVEQLPGSGRVDEPEPKATTSEPQLPQEFRRISQQVEQQFAELVQQQLLSVQGNEEWLAIELKSSLLFASGEAALNPEAGPILETLAATVRGGELPIRVEGFTDDRPIASDVYPSNWELSSARAASVVKLLAENGVRADRLAAIGYGEFQPVGSNATEEGRAANRRVVLMISRSARLRPQFAPPPAPATAAGPVAAEPVARQEPLSGQPAAAPVAEAATPPTPAGPPPVVRVELEGGGVLFTSDPERARLLQRTPAAADTPGTETEPAQPR